MGCLAVVVDDELTSRPIVHARQQLLQQSATAKALNTNRSIYLHTQTPRHKPKF